MADPLSPDEGVRAALALAERLSQWMASGMARVEQTLAAIGDIKANTPEDHAAGRIPAYQYGYQIGFREAIKDVAHFLNALRPALSTPVPEEGLPQSPAQAAEGDKTRWMDRKDDLSDAIEASHPLNTGRHDLYQRAMELVGNRHSKGGLVCLVNHLLADADRLRAALSAEGSANAAAARKQEWMPIDSAPKDGTPILLGHWFDDTHGGYFGEPRWLWQSSGSIDGEGIWLDLLDDHIEPANFHTVTHWAPLPAPPLPPSSSPEDQEKAKAAATPTIADPDGEAANG